MVQNKRKGLSDLERHRICVKGQDLRYAKMTYEEFGALLPRPDGRPMASSRIRDVLKEKDRWLALNTSDGTVWERKKELSNTQYLKSIFESGLIEQIKLSQYYGCNFGRCGWSARKNFSKGGRSSRRLYGCIFFKWLAVCIAFKA